MAPYLHLYAPFFFGISEISTLFVSILVIFDDKMGIKVHCLCLSLGVVLPLPRLGVGRVGYLFSLPTRGCFKKLPLYPPPLRLACPSAFSNLLRNCLSLSDPSNVNTLHDETQRRRHPPTNETRRA